MTRTDDDEKVRLAKLRGLPSQRFVAGKWTALRQGEEVTTMIIETPEGIWQARVYVGGVSGEWSVRGPDPDNATHYLDGDLADFDSGNDKDMLCEAKRRARAALNLEILRKVKIP